MKVYLVIWRYSFDEYGVVLVTHDKQKAESYLYEENYRVEEMEMDKKRDNSEICS